MVGVIPADWSAFVVRDPMDAYFIDPAGRLVGDTYGDDDQEHVSVAATIMGVPRHEYDPMLNGVDSLYALLNAGWMRLVVKPVATSIETRRRPSDAQLRTVQRLVWGADRAALPTVYYDFVPVGGRDDDAISGSATKLYEVREALDQAYPPARTQRIPQEPSMPRRRRDTYISPRIERALTDAVRNGARSRPELLTALQRALGSDYREDTVLLRQVAYHLAHLPAAARHARIEEIDRQRERWFDNRYGGGESDREWDRGMRVWAREHPDLAREYRELTPVRAPARPQRVRAGRSTAGIGFQALW